ncbi:MAG: hypothetical protein IPK78_12135 [Rhodospirillales bacterium]|nr:hypothetical protein [Rhodospirillales bacterium]
MRGGLAEAEGLQKQITVPLMVNTVRRCLCLAQNRILIRPSRLPALLPGAPRRLLSEVRCPV